ncbi:MAG: manganese-dependent inorganic pyrophosphatase [Archaeoglobaceae archaeon]|nr:manganese-dependent inorganic pyrophosphatase [Archaeoglobaceae archaeon]MCX8151710.1 manganese-dependent inorganic pyrophosphatase [Archaeoglobaceae archaeon]MDW8013839.1 manganese-dependent inorganic pyrophosphatase [Archaeoglobaceae archaeon]
MKHVVYVVGHKNPDTDSVCSAIALAYLWNKWKETGKLNNMMKIDVEAKPAVQGDINAETRFVLGKFGFEVPEKLTDASGKKVVLIDHSEKGQSLDNIDKAEILAIIDHHKIGDITTPQPILFVNLPVGCTATVLKLLFDNTGIEIPKNVAGILLSSILSDTVVFKSPTTTELDKAVASDLAKKVGVTDLTKLGIEIKSKLSEIEGMTARQIIMRDFKDFTMAGKKVGIGQVELVDVEAVKPRIDEIYEELKKIKTEGKYHSIFLMLTDIIKEGTELVSVTDDPKIVEKAFGKKLEAKSVWLPKVMSRKKEVVPPLEKAFASK